LISPSMVALESSDASSQDVVQVHLAVLTLTGEAILEDIVFPATGTFKEVKKVVQAASGMPERQQRLVWQHSVVEDSSTLGEVLPHHGALLELMLVQVPVSALVLEDAVGNLDNLSLWSISELKAYAKPPESVMNTMCAVMIVMEKTPSWKQCKMELYDIQFVQKIKMFDASNISANTLLELRKYMENPKFTPELVGKVCVAAGVLCQWVHAVAACAELNHGAVQL